MRCFWGCLLLVAACGGVDNPAIDAPPQPDAPRAIDAPHDTPAGPNCMTDSFDGNVLAAHWSVLAGAVPTTYAVNNSSLLVTDAPFASTPSSPSTSWIYDLDLDKGNQMAWAQTIGGQDFTLTADMAWSSAAAEITLGGVGVSDATGKLAGYVAAQDGSSSGTAPPVARIHVATGSDLEFVGTEIEPGNAMVKIQRVSGNATITIDNTEVLSGPMPDLISNVVIVFVRHSNGATQYTYGSFELRSLTICQP
jgi:hypothetical protein